MVVVSRASALLPEGLEVHQLLCGREIASDIKSNVVHSFAWRMANYVYVVLDRENGEAVVVDAAWDVDGLEAFCEREKVRLVGAVVTHEHVDHCGGTFPRAYLPAGSDVDVRLPGLAELAGKGVPVFAGRHDVAAILKLCEVGADAVRPVEDGDAVTVGVGGRIRLEVLETPGHTPGSVCFLLRKGADAKGADAKGDVAQAPGVVFTGDTLFIGSCGRVDLPNSDPAKMLQSLNRLAQLPEDTVVLPGHNYAFDPDSSIGQEKTTNAMVMQAMQRLQQQAAQGASIAPEPVAALLPLPDYLGVARAALAQHAEAQKNEQGDGEHHHGQHRHECGSVHRHECGSVHPPMPKASNLESHF